MLSPEVRSWPPGGSAAGVRLEQQPRAAPAAVRRLLRRQRARLYHAVALVFPDEFRPPAALGLATRADAAFYRLTSCPPALLVDERFVDAFVRSGSVVCLSINRHSDVDNCIAITVDGILILHIVDKLYQELGLQGTRTSRNFFEVLIDLKAENLKNPQYYKKLYDTLLKLDSFDFIIKWKPDKEDICPSSVAKYFFDKNIEINISETQVTMATRQVKDIPSILEGDISELVEWTGMLVLGADIEPEIDYISTYLQPDDENSLHSTQVAILVAKGLFTADDLETLYEELQNYTATRDNESYWAALCFQSFVDSPCDAHPCIQFKTCDATCTIFSHKEGNTIHITENVR